MKADIIILTNTANGYIRSFTQRAIDSLLDSEQLGTFNVILVESNKDAKEYKNVDKWLVPEEKFNYNKFLNIAYEACDKSDDRYLIVSNNDVEFHKGWFTVLTQAMNQFNLDTASPRSKQYQIGVHPLLETRHRSYLDNQVIVGFEIISEFCGWCWCCNHKIAKTLFPLPEEFSFWFQDNDIVKTLQLLNLKHGLVAGSWVDHMGQQSYKTIDQTEIFSYTNGLEECFKKKWN